MYYSPQMMPLTAQQLQRLQNYQQAVVTTTGGNAQAEARKEVREKKPVTYRDLYVEIEIENTTDKELELVLFDAIDAYALQQNYNQPAGLNILGVSKNYQLVVNKLISGKFLVKDIHLETLSGKEQQFARPWSFFDDTLKVDTISVSKSLYPTRGRISMQEQLNLQELKGVNHTISASTALTTKVVPQNRYIIRIYMAEIRYSE